VNTRMRKVELSNSAARLPADWNVATGNFLRRCECSARVHLVLAPAWVEA
jgi:hypothetical protein